MSPLRVLPTGHEMYAAFVEKRTFAAMTPFFLVWNFSPGFSMLIGMGGGLPVCLLSVCQKASSLDVDAGLPVSSA